MGSKFKSVIVWILLYNIGVINIITVSAQDLLNDADRDKRALDLGLVLRNILLKSAYASNTKAAVSRNLLNAKVARTTTTTTTTTTPRPPPATLPPLFGKKNAFLFPFDFLSASSGAYSGNNKFNIGTSNNAAANNAAAVANLGAGVGIRGGVRGGYLNFDYDYADPPRQVAPARRRRPTTTTAAPTTTTAAAPATPAALPPRRRPLGGFNGRPFLNYDYYYDYDYPEDVSSAVTAAPPPPASRRPRPRQRRPLPPSAAGFGPYGPPGFRGNRPVPLRNPISQYAQTNDISISNNNNNNNNIGGGVGRQGSNNQAAVNDNDNNNAQLNSNNSNNDDNDDLNNASDNEDNEDVNTNNEDINNNNNDDGANNNNANNAASSQSSNENDVSALDYDADPNANFDAGNPEDYNDSSDNNNDNLNDNNQNNDSNNDNSNGNGINIEDPNAQTNIGNLQVHQFPNINFNSNPNGFPNNPLNQQYTADFPVINGQQQNQGFAAFGGLPQFPTGNQNFGFSSFNNFGTQYQQPSNPVGYSVRYY